MKKERKKVYTKNQDTEQNQCFHCNTGNWEKMNNDLKILKEIIFNLDCIVN